MSASVGSESTLAIELRHAIDWRVRLDSGTATEDDRLTLTRWLDADARHRAAWERIDRVFAAPASDIARLEGRRAGAMAATRHALTRRALPRRKLIGGAVGLLLGATTGALVNRQTPVATLFAELRTGTNERRSTALADGSELMLDARSAVDSDVTHTTRRLRLQRGQVALRIPADPLRPFVVATRHGAVETAAGRLSVQQTERFTRISVIERDATVLTHSGLRRALRAGESLAFGHDHIEKTTLDAAARSAWTEGLLDVSDEPLGEVIDALRAYSAGVIRITQEAERLRVFGVFPLDAPARVLRSLGDTLPIVIRQVGPWLTLIERR